MATAVQLRHPKTGINKIGYFGFSWTALFFGAMPLLFSGDIVLFAIAFVAVLALGFTILPLALVAQIVWAFVFNKFYTTRLIEQGYEFADGDASRVADAKRALSIA